jgi:hypothetical protein
MLALADVSYLIKAEVHRASGATQFVVLSQ